MTAIGLNLLLGSYSQGLLVQRAQSVRAQAADKGQSGEIGGVGETRGTESLVGGIEPVRPAERETEPEAVAERKKSVLERFSDGVKDRLEKSAQMDPVAASVKAEQLVQTAVEIGGAMGQAKANEFMNKILAAADRKLASDGDPLELAATTFFAETAEASTANPRAYQELERARRTLDQAVSDPRDDQNETWDDPVSQNGPVFQNVADPRNTSPQARLYQSYVAARPNYAQFSPAFQNPSGNMVNAVA
ncbi:MAG: hypothetical protein LBP95_02425 [Deltaproteobacteria bacterium]|jgi:hypothetical protein|nr:hypothetical protein [Deltaproteobacteria bacterium]